MTKKKNFHGPGGKGGLVRQRAFYCKKNPYDVMAQPLSNKQKNAPASAANVDEGKVEQSLPDTDSTTTITESGGNDKYEISH